MAGGPDDPGAPTVDSAGVGALFDTGITMNVNYDIGDFRFFVQGRYLGDTKLSATWTEGRETDRLKVDARFYTDVNVAYAPADQAWEVFGNVQNLFGVEPPLAPGFLSGFSGATQTNESAYDLLGTRFTVGLRLRM